MVQCDQVCSVWCVSFFEKDTEAKRTGYSGTQRLKGLVIVGHREKNWKKSEQGCLCVLCPTCPGGKMNYGPASSDDYIMCDYHIKAVMYD